jgi:general secretion pathway protein D
MLHLLISGPSRLAPAAKYLAIACLCAGASACQSSDKRTPVPIVRNIADESISRPEARQDATDVIGAGSDETGLAGRLAGQDSDISVIPGIVAQQQPQTAAGGGRAPAPRVSSVDVKAMDVPVPLFIQTVFGEWLQVPFVLDEQVSTIANKVHLTTSGPYAADELLDVATNILESYGVRVAVEDGVYKFYDDQSLRAQAPQFIKARSLPDTLDKLRPVVFFRQLNAIDGNEMSSMLKEAYKGRERNALKVDVNNRANIIILSGLPEDVRAASLLVDQMDEPAYAGTKLIRYSPTYRSANDVAGELKRLLTAEGWQASDNVSIQRTVLVIPIEFTNDLFIFSKSEAALSRARFHLASLDRPGLVGDVPQLFVYDVQNVDAKVMADIVNRVLGQSSQRESRGAVPGQSPVSQDIAGGIIPASGGGAGGTGIGGTLVVDTISNRLIFSGTASDYRRLEPLLQQLDKSSGEVLIQVTIAEVTLTDETKYGLEFFVDSLGNEDVNVTLGTSGTGLGGSGLNVGILSGNVEAALNAFASNNVVNVLSKPKLIARSGGAARIQVGTDVPVITSQRAANQQDGDGITDVLQSVDYRKTGVLLTIEPIIFSQNRVDLTVSQEVSTAIPNNNSSIASPTISSRTLDTQLSIEDGETVVLGGLIQTDVTEGETGVPLIKDIPIAGNLFKSKSVSQSRTELLVLITAYILRGRDDKAEFTQRIVRDLEETASDPANLVTIMPERPGQYRLQSTPGSD